MKANNRKYYWTGKITTTAGTVYNFDQEDMVKGSGYITSQCCGSTEIELGTVYAAEMGLSLFSEINRYTLMDAKVELFYHLQVAGGSYETIPMGIFEISEANRKAKCMEIKAYDYMVRFEKAFTSLESIGNAYDFMVLCSTACNVDLAQDRATINAMPNGSENLSIYSDNDIETYRDVLFYVGQVLGGFFVINRSGELELKKYGDQPVLVVERKHRFTSSFSDFITRYTAVSSTNLRTQIAEYYASEPDDGLTMNLGVNPLLQFGLEETRKQLCENILADLSLVNYVPFDSDTIGNPALDVGDILSFTGGQADSSKYACITSNSIKIGGRQTIKCVGRNPKLAQAKSKNDKNISGLLAQIEAGKIGIHTFTNASAFTVQDVDTKIISIEFATTEANHAQFFGQVIVDVTAQPVTKSATATGDVVIPSVPVDEPEPEDLDEPEVIGNTEEQTITISLPMSWTEDGHADVIFSFEFNNQMIPVHYPQENWHSGRHTILLYYPIEDVVPNYTNIFNVYMRCEGGTAFVDTGMCIASISGQSMIAAVGLTSKHGGANAYGSEVTVDSTLLQIKKVSLDDEDGFINDLFRCVTVDFANAKLYALCYESNTVMIKRYRMPVFDIGLNEKLDDSTLTLEDTTVLQCSTFHFYGSYTPYGIFMDGGDGYWYGFANQGNSSGSATVLWIKIKQSDYSYTEGSWTLSNATLMTMGSFKEESSYSRGSRNAVVRNGYLYVGSYDKTGVYKINISNHTDITLISLGFTSAWRCLGETGSTDCCLSILNDIIIGYDFEIDVNDNVIATFAGTRCGNVSTPFFQYKEYVFAWGGAYLNQYRYTWILTPYLATICNLSQAVLKNADKTMKITYTLTEQTVEGFG